MQRINFNSLAIALSLYGAVIITGNQVAYNQVPTTAATYPVGYPVPVQVQQVAVPVQVQQVQPVQAVPVQYIQQGTVVQAAPAAAVNPYQVAPQVAEDNDAFYQQMYNQ